MPDDDKPYQQASMRALGRSLGEMYAGMIEGGMPIDLAYGAIIAYITALGTTPAKTDPPKDQPSA